ncbi:MAG: hypothetical protein WCX97_03085 [Candidatus Magasanikbacteria bacterium]
MIKTNIPNIEDDKEEEQIKDAGCDCCEGDCDCGDCDECSGEKKNDDDLLVGDDSYISEYSDGNIEDDSRLYGRSLDKDEDNDND